MNFRLTPVVALLTAIAPNCASAIGFGDISLHSRLGEALRAEIPLIDHAAGQAPQAACFTLVAANHGDLPNLTSASLRIVTRNGNPVLQISGRRAIADPLFQLTVRATCGYDIERSYLLMPDAPLMAEPVITTTSVPPPAAGGGRIAAEHIAAEGETIGDIVETQPLESRAERRRLARAIRRANPHLNFAVPLPEGTLVRIPELPPRADPAPERLASPPPPVEAIPPQARKAKKAPIPGGTDDRLVLGAAPELGSIDSRKPAPAPAAPLGETEERLLKLETTLRLLTQEVDKLDQAIDLATKSIEAQNKLQALNNDARPQVAAVTPARPSGTDDWLELGLGATLGAAGAFGLMQYLGRRRRFPGDAELPLVFAAARQPTRAPASAVDDFDDESNAAPRTVRQATAPVARPIDAQVSDLPIDDEHSVLALAEIMLAYGRDRGAVETLAEHIAEKAPESILPWSKLLDLYRRTGMEKEFILLAQRMRERFNIAMPRWDDGTPQTGLLSLEDYQHAIEQVSSRWGTQACLDYLYGLAHDNRAGQRSGFPLEVVEDIAVLMQVLEAGYGLKRQR